MHRKELHRFLMGKESKEEKKERKKEKKEKGLRTVADAKAGRTGK